ncbi:hypothetical protein OC834_008033, partial [Tilletia horrida]
PGRRKHPHLRRRNMAHGLGRQRTFSAPRQHRGGSRARQGRPWSQARRSRSLGGGSNPTADQQHPDQQVQHHRHHSPPRHPRRLSSPHPRQGRLRGAFRQGVPQAPGSQHSGHPHRGHQHALRQEVRRPRVWASSPPPSRSGPLPGASSHSPRSCAGQPLSGHRGPPLHPSRHLCGAESALARQREALHRSSPARGLRQLVEGDTNRAFSSSGSSTSPIVPFGPHRPSHRASP